MTDGLATDGAEEDLGSSCPFGQWPHWARFVYAIFQDAAEQPATGLSCGLFQRWIRRGARVSSDVRL